MSMIRVENLTFAYPSTTLDTPLLLEQTFVHVVPAYSISAHGSLSTG